MTAQEPDPVCLITGGSDGIGLATARRFRSADYRIAICGRSADRLAAARQTLENDPGSELITIQADISNSDEAVGVVRETIERLGQIDVLVNNAGAAPLAMIEETGDTMLDQVIDTNVRAPFVLIRAAWPHLKQSSGGTIVNISSMAAVDPFPGFSIYGASKAWLELLTRALAAEGVDDNIRVCAVRPGAVETSLLRGLFPDFPPEQCVTPERIAEEVWRCVAEPTGYSSGETFQVTSDEAT